MSGFNGFEGRKKLNINKPILFVILVLFVATLGCSIFDIQQKAQTARGTANAFRTDVGGIINEGSSLLKTAQAIETQHPGILGTVKAVATQGAPVLSTIGAATTSNPGLVKTAQAAIQQEIPTGEAPSDIPLMNQEQVQNYFGSSQYIFYTSPIQYDQVLEFYKTEMPNNGWQYIETDSHEYSNAAQLTYVKDNRTATINLAFNPLNNTSVIVINLTSH
jgi:hypothetical protein